VLGAIAQFEKASLVTKLKAARDGSRGATANARATGHTGQGIGDRGLGKAARRKYGQLKYSRRPFAGGVSGGLRVVVWQREQGNEMAMYDLGDIAPRIAGGGSGVAFRAQSGFLIATTPKFGVALREETRNFKP
jgi:hypothetical protein